MDALSAAAALITLAALFSWLNHLFIRQPPSIALLLFSLALSLALVALGKLGFDSQHLGRQAIQAIELDRALLDSMLSFLLFAGALHVDLSELARRRWAIGFLASIGVVISAILAGAALWLIFGLLGHAVPFIWCLLFGALISPTDPIAVLAIPAVLAARLLSVGIAALVPGLRADFPPYVIGVLTWGGLRGGISVALALALPSGPHRPAIITVTYVVVLFSILVQGLTLSRLLRRRVKAP